MGHCRLSISTVALRNPMSPTDEALEALIALGYNFTDAAGGAEVNKS